MATVPLRTRMRRAWPILAALAVILVVAGALRAEQATGPHGPLSKDERAYEVLAANLAAGGGYGGRPRALHWAPGAPVAFAAAERVLGSGTAAIYALQWLCGVLLVLVIFGLGWALAGPITGLVAAAAVAVYPPLIGLSGSLLSEGPGTLAVAVAALLSVLAVRRKHVGWWAAAGVAWGGTILVRADLLAAPVFVAAAVFVAAVVTSLRNRRPAWGALAAPAVLLVATVVTIAPWSMVATNRTGEFVPVTTGGGSALWVGTYLPGGGTTVGAKRAMYSEIVARKPKLAGERALSVPAMTMMDTVAARHPQMARDAAIKREARRNLTTYPFSDPGGYALMTLDKFKRMWGFPTRASSIQPSHLLTLLHPYFVILAVLAICVILLRRRDLAYAVVAAPVAASAFVHAIVVANPRYALVMLPLLFTAGIAAATVWLRGLPADVARLRALLPGRHPAPVSGARMR